MNTDTPVRVMIVDDQAVVRSGLSAFLMAFDGFELVAEARSGEEAIHICEQAQPEVILMDLKMPGMSGAAATLEIRRRWPHIQVLALTSFKEKELVQAALDAGAMGYLLKDISAEKLAEAIRAVKAGRLTLAPEAAETLDLAEKLERLARLLIGAPADASRLPAILSEHLPKIFSNCSIDIHLLDGQELYCSRQDGDLGLPRTAWDWLTSAGGPHYFAPGLPLPWGGETGEQGLMVAPLYDLETRQVEGGMWVARQREGRRLGDLLPAVKTVVEQVASTLNAARAYRRALAQQKMAQELALAGQIQASLLPAKPPALPGWQISARLVPARETSGDFYDFIPLPAGRWGLVVADVTDKGVGPALFMAVSRTLLRTYAQECPSRPGQVLTAVNRRILSDSQAGLFVTVFYAVLDPHTGRLLYGNAGHNPPLLFRSHGIHRLSGTGTVLGILDEETWRYRQVTLVPGDLLILYTDGIPEAQNPAGQFYDLKRVEEIAILARQNWDGQSDLAQDVSDAILADLHNFTGKHTAADDITLVVLTRKDLHR